MTIRRSAALLLRILTTPLRKQGLIGGVQAQPTEQKQMLGHFAGYTLSARGSGDMTCLAQHEAVCIGWSVTDPHLLYHW